jgi:hypothetical protein
VEEGLGSLSDADAELLTRVLDRLAADREAAAAASPGPERLYPADGYSRALLIARARLGGGGSARQADRRSGSRTYSISASTTSGSNCVPECRSSSAIAAWCISAAR